MGRNDRHAPQHLAANRGKGARTGRPPAGATRKSARAPADSKKRMESRSAATDARRATASHSTTLFEKTVFPTVEHVHRINQSGLRAGVVWLFLLPVILLIVRRLTDSSKVAFLIIWIIGMFFISAALIFVAYTDHELKRFLGAVKEHVPAAADVELDGLVELDGTALPIAPNRLRALLNRRRQRGMNAAQEADSVQDAADLKKLDDWLRQLELREQEGKRHAKHPADHTR